MQIIKTKMQLKHLYQALFPMFLVTLLSGTSAIYPQQKNGSYCLNTSSIFKVITMLYLTIYTITIIFGVQNLDTKTNFSHLGNTMLGIGLVLDSVGQIVLIYTIYICSFITPSNIKNILDKMADIDSVLNKMGHKNNYSKTFWQQIVLLYFGIFSIIFTTVLQFLVISKNPIGDLQETIWFVYFFPMVIIFIMEYQFSFIVFLIYQRFQVINGILHEMSANVDKKFKAKDSTETVIRELEVIKVKQSSSPPVLRKVETLMQIHDSVVDAATDLNTNYSFQVLICLAVLFIKTVFAIFFAYHQHFTLGKLDVALNWGVWAAIGWNQIMLITVTCHLATTQAQQTGVEVHKLLMNSEEDIIRDKLIVFSQQVFQRPVEFTACGLFSIDAQLIFAILGSAATYLLIMLQFQEGTEANCVIANYTT